MGGKHSRVRGGYVPRDGDLWKQMAERHDMEAVHGFCASAADGLDHGNQTYMDMWLLGHLLGADVRADSSLDGALQMLRAGWSFARGRGALNDAERAIQAYATHNARAHPQLVFIAQALDTRARLARPLPPPPPPPHGDFDWTVGGAPLAPFEPVAVVSVPAPLATPPPAPAAQAFAAAPAPAPPAPVSHLAALASWPAAARTAATAAAASNAPAAPAPPPAPATLPTFAFDTDFF